MAILALHWREDIVVVVILYVEEIDATPLIA